MVKQIKVIMVEAFNGKKYLIKIEEGFDKILNELLVTLMGNSKVGSIAFISIRFIDEDKYLNIRKPKDMKGINDGKKENSGKENSKKKITTT